MKQKPMPQSRPASLQWVDLAVPEAGLVFGGSQVLMARQDGDFLPLEPRK